MEILLKVLSHFAPAVLEVALEEDWYIFDECKELASHDFLNFWYFFSLFCFCPISTVFSLLVFLLN